MSDDSVSTSDSAASITTSSGSIHLNFIWPLSLQNFFSQYDFRFPNFCANSLQIIYFSISWISLLFVGWFRFLVNQIIRSALSKYEVCAEQKKSEGSLSRCWKVLRVSSYFNFLRIFFLAGASEWHTVGFLCLVFGSQYRLYGDPRWAH